MEMWWFVLLVIVCGALGYQIDLLDDRIERLERHHPDIMRERKRK